MNLYLIVQEQLAIIACTVLIISDHSHHPTRCFLPCSGRLYDELFIALEFSPPSIDVGCGLIDQLDAIRWAVVILAPAMQRASADLVRTRWISFERFDQGG